MTINDLIAQNGHGVITEMSKHFGIDYQHTQALLNRKRKTHNGDSCEIWHVRFKRFLTDRQKRITAHLEGYAACGDDLPKSANPYLQGDPVKFAGWNDGYDAAVTDLIETA